MTPTRLYEHAKEGAKDIVNLDDNDPSLKLTKFECDRIDYHFANATPGAYYFNYGKGRTTKGIK